MNDGLISISIAGLQGFCGNKEAIRLAREAGAEAIDLCLMDRTLYNLSNPKSIYSKSDEEIYEYFEDLGKYARSIGLVVGQTHGKSAGFKNIPDEDDILVENIKRDILATKALGAPICVVHTTTSIYMGPNPDPELMHKLNLDQFIRTLPDAKKHGIILATETFGDAVRYSSCDFFGQLDQFIDGFERIASYNGGEFKDYIAVCADTGHSNKAKRYGQPSAADVIRACGPRLKALHLNDNDSFTDQHRIPGMGTINWNDVFDALKEVNYSGTYNLELNDHIYGDDFIFEHKKFAIKALKHMLRSRGM